MLCITQKVCLLLLFFETSVEIRVQNLGRERTQQPSVPADPQRSERLEQLPSLSLFSQFGTVGLVTFSGNFCDCRPTDGAVHHLLRPWLSS